MKEKARLGKCLIKLNGSVCAVVLKYSKEVLHVYALTSLAFKKAFFEIELQL